MAAMALEQLHPDLLFDTTARLTHLNGLRSALDLPSLPIPESRIFEEDRPTIGIEIEMTWVQAFRSMQERWLDSPDRPGDHSKDSPLYQAFADAYNDNDSRLLPILEKIRPVIPRVGTDAYWEFSFRPTKDASITSAELATLYEAGILFKDIQYATHMTLAGITNDRDASTILCMLEQAGGTTLKRLESVHTSQKGGWARKLSPGGFRRRPGYELEGNDEIAYEFRTLVTTSPEQMSRLLRLGQKLASICLHDEDTWHTIQAKTEHSLKERGLPLRVWHSPKENPEIWRRYGETLLNAASAN